MADLTTTQIDELIELARSALVTALTNPKPNYTIGEMTIDYADYIKMLREQLSSLREIKSESASENVRNFDSDITNTGEDNTEYEGDNNI